MRVLRNQRSNASGLRGLSQSCNRALESLLTLIKAECVKTILFGFTFAKTKFYIFFIFERRFYFFSFRPKKIPRTEKYPPTPGKLSVFKPVNPQLLHLGHCVNCRWALHNKRHQNKEKRETEGGSGRDAARAQEARHPGSLRAQHRLLAIPPRPTQQPGSLGPALGLLFGSFSFGMGDAWSPLLAHFTVVERPCPRN